MNTPKSRALILLENIQKEICLQYSDLPTKFWGRDSLSNNNIGMIFERRLKREQPNIKKKELKKLKKEHITAMKRYLKPYVRHLPTDFESPFLYSEIEGFINDIEDSIKVQNYLLPCKPVFGSLHTGNINAISIQVPSENNGLDKENEYIVILEMGILVFSHIMSTLASRAIDFKVENRQFVFTNSEAAIAKVLMNEENLYSVFRETLLKYLFKGWPVPSMNYYPGKSYEWLANILRDSMLLFVVGHEYGHIIKKHFSSSIIKKIKIGYLNLNEMVLSCDQEFEADQMGLKLIINLPKYDREKIPLCLRYFGSDYFFSCVDVFEKSISLFKYGDDSCQISNTHPRAVSRRDRLRSVLSNLIPNLNEKDVYNAVVIAKSLEIVNNLLWSSIKDELDYYYQKGIKLHDIWR